MFFRGLLKRASVKYGYEIAPESIIGPGIRLVHRGEYAFILLQKLEQMLQFFAE